MSVAVVSPIERESVAICKGLRVLVLIVPLLALPSGPGGGT